MIAGGAHARSFDVDAWPWERDGLRILPAPTAGLEYTRAVRAHLDAHQPDAVVVELPASLERPWREALASLPRISAISVASGALWRFVAPALPLVEAGRWALENGRRLVVEDLPAFAAESALRSAPPDGAALPSLGYAALAGALAQLAAVTEADSAAGRALGAAAVAARRTGERVAVVCAPARLAGVMEGVASGGASPLARPDRREGRAIVLDPASLAELLDDPPFVHAAWERWRSGERPSSYWRSEETTPVSRLVAFPGTSLDDTGVGEADPGSERDREAQGRGEDLLARARLGYRVVLNAARRARETSGTVPTQGERRILHRFARNLALVEGRLVPDLFQLVVAARGAVDDRFARDLYAVASEWPWGPHDGSGARLSAEDVGRSSRLVRLRPRIDRLSRRPALIRSLREAQSNWRPGPEGICSHVPEDVVVEAVGADLRRLGARRASRAGVRLAPFSASLLDGVDFRETLRRYVSDGRVWVREEVGARAAVGAVILDFVEAGPPERAEPLDRYPWSEVWHGEHDDESDMAFYATDPRPGWVAPGIHRAEYGGYLLIWPPRRLGDVWHDPAYRFCESPLERLIVAGLDYATDRLVVVVSSRRPRAVIRSLARRLGRAIVQIPPGVLSPAKWRSLKSFHVLAGRHLRSLAEQVIEPD